MASTSDEAFKRVAANRKALHDYAVIERFEAGIALAGTEVKSVRAAQVNLGAAFAKVADGQATLYNLNISPYEFGNRFNHDPDRPRRLLLHRKELAKLEVQTAQKGLTLVPLSLYLKHGKVKVELGLCRGRQQADKREHLKQAEHDRETARALAGYRH